MFLIPLCLQGSQRSSHFSSAAVAGARDSGRSPASTAYAGPQCPPGAEDHAVAPRSAPAFATGIQPSRLCPDLPGMRTPRHLPAFGSSTRGAPGAAAPLVGWSPGGKHSPPRFSEGSEAAASADAPPGRSAPKCCPRKERGSLRRFEPREDLAGGRQVPGAPSRPPFLLAHGPHLSLGPVPRV